MSEKGQKWIKMEQNEESQQKSTFSSCETHFHAAKNPLDYQFDSHATNLMFDIEKLQFTIFAPRKWFLEKSLFLAQKVR